MVGYSYCSYCIITVVIDKVIVCYFVLVIGWKSSVILLFNLNTESRTTDVRLSLNQSHTFMTYILDIHWFKSWFCFSLYRWWKNLWKVCRKIRQHKAWCRVSVCLRVNWQHEVTLSDLCSRHCIDLEYITWQHSDAEKARILLCAWITVVVENYDVTYFQFRDKMSSLIFSGEEQQTNRKFPAEVWI